MRYLKFYSNFYALIASFNFQTSLCNTEEMNCVLSINSDKRNCMPRCSGMQVSSYDKESIEKNTGLLQNIDTHASMMLKILEELYADMKKSLPASLTAWSKN